MSRKKNHVTCNYHYHYMMPTEMAPMGVVYGMDPMSEMPTMYDNCCPMPNYQHGSHYGSHLDGNPHFDGDRFSHHFSSLFSSDAVSSRFSSLFFDR